MIRQSNLDEPKNSLQLKADWSIINAGGALLNILPGADRLVIPVEKFTNYALDPQRQKDKAIAFEKALGYNLDNFEKLIENIKRNITKFPAIPKPDIGYGQRYQVTVVLTGENGKQAKVLTAWIIDKNAKQTRLISVYIDK